MTRDRMLEPTILTSNLVSGVVWCAAGLVAGAWPAAAIGLVYVSGASLFLAIAYRRPPGTRTTEVAIWTATWLAAVAVWAVLLVVVGGDVAVGLPALLGAVQFGTLTFAGWQLLALAIREGFHRSNRSPRQAL